MPSYLQLCQSLRRETGTAGAGPVTVQNQSGQIAQLVAWVNQAYLDILNKWVDWKFMWREGGFTATPGGADYQLESDLRELNEDSVYMAGGSLGGDAVKLEKVEYDDYRRSRSLYAYQGTPGFFTIRPDGSLRLLPTPDDAYSLAYEYWCKPEALSNNGDVPVFPEAHHDAILWKAAMFWAGFNEAEAEFQKFSYHFDTAIRLLEAACLPAPDSYHNRAQGVDLVVETI